MPSIKVIVGIAAAIVFLGGGAAVYYYRHRAVPAPQVAQSQPAAAAAAPESGIQNPVPAQHTEQPLPELQDSDPSMLQALIGLYGERPIAEFLVPQEIIRHAVVTIDNLPRKKIALRLSPMKQTGGKFAIEGDSEAATLKPENYARYAPFIRLVQTTDTKTLVALYFRFYPLFQKAYQDLGNPDQYFNDRLVQVIDHLLAAPEVQAPVKLVQPNVFYEFEDPELEGLSFGQKAMIRMGDENATALKAKLREIRAAIANKKD